MAARAMQNAVNGPRPNQFTSTLMTRRRPASRVPRAIWTPRSRLIRSSVLRAARPAKVHRSCSATVSRIPASPAMAADRVRFHP